MQNQELEQLRYPIGKFQTPPAISQNDLENWILVLEELPKKLEAMVAPLTEEQLETPYRPGGWTVRQLVHHISDSHHNSYLRFKWALTEDNPVIKPYNEKAWAELFDSRTAPIQMSLDHLKAVHAKLVYLIKGLTAEQLQRKFTHPDGNQESTLELNVGRYAWHSNHHFAHIAHLIEREGW
ncbi:YfiT family bacillithiol transferase [Allomuricauda sp. NBRC 101325]|uniref:YfiT family bacillithiol transferase n=1 Tax=Allomuricauda sp. NBRC 101325 TaxID=1113758 RepID=UPI0024A04B50|nr:bacillithiol transferase BstA [Muricauda sp. NBRC 101325]GLU44107.1 putative metal-dependent hydrolase YfiT [Muricauda sp. NBRC 101325]